MDKTLGYLKKNGVKIKLADGNVHELKFDLNALEYLEEQFGDIESIENVSLDKPKNIKIFLRAGLLHEYAEGQEPTLNDIGKLVNVEMIMNFEQYIGEALILSLPSADTEENEEVKKK